MITFSNNKKIDFVAASGALGFTGSGYFWEQPFRWTGHLKTKEFTFITKTLTYKPNAGNYRWYCPWRTFRLVKGNTVNALGLPNPGLDYWIKNQYVEDAIVSVFVQHEDEAMKMAASLNPLDLTAVEINAVCPHWGTASEDAIAAFISKCKHPTILKIGHGSHQIALAEKFKGKVEAFDAINSVPWKFLYSDPSPLTGSSGSVSGPIIKDKARNALVELLLRGCSPVISGGGIDSLEEVYLRERFGAKAFSIGTLFLRKPWLPNQIVRQYRKNLL